MPQAFESSDSLYPGPFFPIRTQEELFIGVINYGKRFEIDLKSYLKV